MNELLINAVGPLREWFFGLGDIGMVLWIVLKILAIAMPVIISVAFYVVWERKLIGWMHVRHGPMYVGMGIFQAFADVFKLLFKEIIQPSSAQKAMYVIAPLIVLAPAFAAWAVSLVMRSRSCALASSGSTRPRLNSTVSRCTRPTKRSALPRSRHRSC